MHYVCTTGIETLLTQWYTTLLHLPCTVVVLQHHVTYKKEITIHTHTHHPSYSLSTNSFTSYRFVLFDSPLCSIQTICVTCDSKYFHVDSYSLQRITHEFFTFFWEQKSGIWFHQMCKNNVGKTISDGTWSLFRSGAPRSHNGSYQIIWARKRRYQGRIM